MQLSKSNQIIIDAVKLGYQLINNQIHTPDGKLLKHVIRTKKQTKGWGKSYSSINTQICLNGKRLPIIVARFIAYLKFGNLLFQPGIIVRHKDNNSLNNKWDNILLGTKLDNYNDIPKEEKLITSQICSIKKRKLTDNQIRDIQKRVIILNEDRNLIAKEFNVQLSSICNYVNWKFDLFNYVKYFRKSKGQWIFLGR